MKQKSMASIVAQLPPPQPPTCLLAELKEGSNDGCAVCVKVLMQFQQPGKQVKQRQQMLLAVDQSEVMFVIMLFSVRSELTPVGVILRIEDPYLIDVNVSHWDDGRRCSYKLLRVEQPLAKLRINGSGLRKA